MFPRLPNKPPQVWGPDPASFSTTAHLDGQQWDKLDQIGTRGGRTGSAQREPNTWAGVDLPAHLGQGHQTTPTIHRRPVILPLAVSKNSSEATATPNSQPHHHTTPHNLGLCRASPEGVKPKTPRRCQRAEALGEVGAPGSPPPADASCSLCSSLLEAGQRYTHTARFPARLKVLGRSTAPRPAPWNKQQWKEERGTWKLLTLQPRVSHPPQTFRALTTARAPALEGAAGGPPHKGPKGATLGQRPAWAASGTFLQWPLCSWKAQGTGGNRDTGHIVGALQSRRPMAPHVQT